MIKKFLFITLAIFGFQNITAQQNFTSDSRFNFSSSKKTDFWQKTSFELGYGFATPISPSTNIALSDYNSFLNFQIGGNYKFNDFLGLRLTYAHHDFENKDKPNLGINYNKFVAEATLSVMNAIYPFTDYSKLHEFDIFAHAGFGGSFIKSKVTNHYERAVNVQFGLKPSYYLNDRLNLFVDVTGVANMFQNFSYSGNLNNENRKSFTGTYFTAMVGVQVIIGE